AHEQLRQDSRIQGPDSRDRPRIQPRPQGRPQGTGPGPGFKGQVKYQRDFELLTTLLLCVVYYDSCLCVSHESKAKVRVFTTAFQESRRAALSLDLLRSIVLRPSNFSL